MQREHATGSHIAQSNSTAAHIICMLKTVVILVSAVYFLITISS